LIVPFAVDGGIVDNYCLNFRFIAYYKPNSFGGRHGRDRYTANPYFN